jgi:hypothetical protein
VGRLTVVAARLVLGLVLVGSVFVQVVMAPLLFIDLGEDVEPSLADVRVPVVALVVLGIVTVQVAVVCVWGLLTMVRRGTVFSPAAFRYVDTIFGALVAAAVLTFALGVVLAPGEAVPPGMVLLIGGLGVGVSGVGLIVLVLRMLLAQAVALDTEAHDLQAELAQVI